MNTKSKTITKRPGRKALGVILLSLAMLLVLLVGIVRAEDLPTIASDKPDYAPGEWVTLTGQNWFADDQVRITVNDDYGSTWNRSVIVEVANGSLSDYFQLPTWFVATYSVTATGMQSGLVATTTFTDANIGTYDQCANDDGDGYATGDTGCRWINGNLQRNNSTYSEGDATVQRLWLTDNLPGSTHTVTIKYGTTKGGKHAYDFLTRWDWSENWITVADRCEGITGCVSATDTYLAIPTDPNAAGFDAAADLIQPRQFTMRGGTLVSATSPVVVSGSYAGDSETVITVSYTVANTGSMCSTNQGVTTCDVAIWFGAHVAMTAQWMAYDGTTGASTVSGSPYHVALDAVDGAAVGQRDNQMQAGAVPLNGTIIIVKDAVPNDAQDFNFNLTNGSTFNQNFSLDDDADPTLLNSRSFSLPAGTYTASELFPLPTGWTFTSLVCTVTGSNGSTAVVLDAQATITLNTAFTTSDTVTCTYTDTKGLPLTATKTADGSYDRTVTWTLDKSVDDDSHTGYAGDSFNSTWTVVADKTEVSDNYKVTGSITINNPNNWAVPVTVTDSLNDSTAATVTCPSSSVPALGSLVCTYTASPANKSATSNTATITSGDPNVSGTSATQNITWTENLTGYDSGNLIDDRFSYDEIISGDTTETFPETFTCSTNPADYTDGSYSYTETNTATLDSNIGLSASDDVTVTCSLQPLVPTKTAAGEWDRTVTWTLDKSVDDDSHTGFAGDSFNSTWTVVADKTDSGPMNFVVAGTIDIYNPASIAQTFSVSDVLNDAAGTAATVSCPSNTVDAGLTVVCSYEAFPTDASATLNTATVSAVGNADQSADDPIEWSENLTGYDSGLLDDPRFNYSATISDDTTETFPDTFTCSTDPADYTDGSYSYTVTNTATLDSNIGLSASDDVTVTCSLQPLVPTKTAAGTYDRTVTWTLDKSVAPASHIGYPGDSFNSTWTVVADKTEVSDNYKVTGNISIYNPASIAQTFSVSDVLNDAAGTAATVTCPSNTVGAGLTVVCSYEAFPTDASATLNTATVSAVGNADQSADDPIEWTESLIGYDSGLLDDTRFSYSATISGDTTETFDETFACSTDRADYTDGSYSYTETNTATLDSNIGLSASADVTVTCNASFVDVLKTTNGNVDPTKDIRFRLYDGAGNDLNDEVSTFGDADGILQFQTALVPGATYTVCESPVPSGYTFEIDVSNGGNVLTYAGPPGAQNPTGEIQCFDFVAAESPTTLLFHVNNSYPGGAPRTPGYWKNWNTCTGGGQDLTAEKLGGVEANVFLLDDLLPQTVGKLEITTCQVGVYVLDSRWAVGNRAGRQASSDAAYELARNYLAARLNQDAGACDPDGWTWDTRAGTGQTFEQVLTEAQNFLFNIGYDGDGDILLPGKKSNTADRTYALFLAGILDDYNNSELCTGTPSH